MLTSRSPDAPPRVFISYSHDSASHRQRVLELANRLRVQDHIDARIDRYVDGTPPDGWPVWMANELDAADFVLVVCTEPYTRRALKREEPGRGLGASWEAGLVTQLVYEEQGRNTRFVPVIFEAGDAAHVPLFLRTATRYLVSDEDGYAALRDYLKGLHGTPMPPLGTSRGQSAEPRPSPAPRGRATEHGTQVRSGAGVPEGLESVVLRFEDGDVQPFGASRVGAAQMLELELVALAPAGAEHLEAIRGHARPGEFGAPPTVAVAYGAPPAFSATWARVREVGRETSAGTTRWRLALEPVESAQDVFDEMTINGHTADDIAGYRARRILLDERPASRGRPGEVMPNALDRSGTRDTMVESAISRAASATGGRDTCQLGPVEGSPLPALFSAWPADRAAFLETARLCAGMWLVLTRTVERVRRLDLAFEGQDRLAVTFEGVRRQVYTNRPPTVVAVSGELALRR